LNESDFAGLMDACGPFEHNPHVAAAVSGGADSLALMHLLKAWTVARQGRLTALTVDHGLRPDSAAEARMVAGWAKAAGIEHHILNWTGDKPQSGLQAAARDARYGLLGAWCRTAHVLHLATAHQLDDQRETVAMRQARGGGNQTGLAGMSLITNREGVRLVRPLLGVPAADLRRFLTALGANWIEDPSNRQERFERIRWRQGLEGPLPTPAEIRNWGKQRARDEEAMADLLMRSADIRPAGHVLVDLDVWKAAPGRLLAPALWRLMATVSGRDYPPARATLDRSLKNLLTGGSVASLGGTLIGRWQGKGLICREAGTVTGTLRTSGLWDRRFRVEIAPNGAEVMVGALSEAGVAEIGQSGLLRQSSVDIPPLARPALPAVRDATGRLIFVPYLGFDPYGRGQDAQFRFLPRNSATSSGFTVAYGWPHTI
jgi:tRNA(Ile)-lysidine synthase